MKVDQKIKGEVTFINKKRKYGVIHDSTDSYLFFYSDSRLKINEGDHVDFQLKDSEIDAAKKIAYNINKL